MLRPEVLFSTCSFSSAIFVSQPDLLCDEGTTGAFSAVTIMWVIHKGETICKINQVCTKGITRPLVIGIPVFALVIVAVFVAHTLPVTVLQVGSYEFNLPKGVTVDMNTPGLDVEKNTVASILVSMRVTGNGEMRFLIGDDVV